MQEIRELDCAIVVNVVNKLKRVCDEEFPRVAMWSVSECR